MTEPFYAKRNQEEKKEKQEKKDILPPQVEAIFPSWIISTKFEGDMEKVREAAKKELYAVPGNLPEQGTFFSINKCVLDRPELKELREFVIASAKHYTLEVMKTKDELFLTDSWLGYMNKTENASKEIKVNTITEGLSLFSHQHPGAYTCGCFYIDTDAETSPIVFKNDHYAWGEMEFNGLNQANAKMFQVHPKPGELILWDNALFHFVPSTQSPNKRRMLAMNFRLGLTQTGDWLPQKETYNRLKGVHKKRIDDQKKYNKKLKQKK